MNGPRILSLLVCHQLKSTSWVIAAAAIVLFTQLLRADDFCAVTLYVTSPQGAPVITKVRVLDPSGKLVLDTTSQAKGLKICDLGFGPHSIVVAHDSCFPTTVSKVRVLKGYPITLNVVVNPCTNYPTDWSGCLVYFRVRSSGGGPVAGAAIRPSTTRDDLVADSFGRAWTPMYSGMSVHFEVTHDGYVSKSLDVTCKDEGPLERLVVLDPVRKGNPQ